MQRMGACNQCGQCCGCETAPERGSPFPKTWPEAVRTWTVDDLSNTVIFQITGHPDLGAPRYGAIKIGSPTFRWIWIPGVGLVADKAPWGDESSYEPQCPMLLPESGGQYPCGVEGTQWDGIRSAFGCRDLGLPDELDEASAQQWVTDHPNCGIWYE